MPVSRLISLPGVLCLLVKPIQLLFCTVYNSCSCASCFYLVAVEEAGAVMGWLKNKLGSGFALLHQALRVCLLLSLSVSQMSLMALGLRAALLWFPLMGLGRSLLVVLTLSCLGVEERRVLSPAFLCAVPSRAALCRHEGCLLVNLLGMHCDFEVLYLGIGSVDFSVPSWLKVVMAGASIQGTWSAVVTVTVKLLCLQTLLGRFLA